jgi:hypothetical protein
MSDKIRVVVAAVGEAAEVREIGSELEPMQEVVGGLIEPLRLSGSIFLIVNEEGRMRGLPPNRCFTPTGAGYLPGIVRPDGRAVGGVTVVGTVFATKTKGEDFVSLTEDEAEELRQFLDAARVE